MDAMNRLKGFRLMKGMTQKRLAQAIGTTQAHVSEYENGTRRLRNMPALQFVRLMTTLDVTPSLLLEDDVERPYDDVRERMRDAEHEVAALRREYAERGGEDALARLVDAETRLGYATREWEAEAERATFGRDLRK